ncbi:TonB-dependent receptor [Parasphingopyxis algicola]|nr:TonB-dependent receptor [Parasphingopyxis algicola]
MTLAIASSSLLALQPAHAQASGAADTESANAPIVVTATRQNASLEDTAGSASVLGADELGPGGIQNVSDLSAAVPNVSVGDQFGVNRTFIRGIGLTSIDLGADGAVAFLQNGAIISRPAAQLSGFYDLQQVEVLRGPQGTLYGRGATAGVINLVTTRPSDELEGYGRLTYGNYDAITVEGAVGGPITDGVMARVAGRYENRDGYGVNLFTGNPVDDRNAWAIRGSLLFEAAPDLEILVVGDYFREDDNNYAFHYFGPTVVPEAALPGAVLGGQTIFDIAAAEGREPDLRNIYSNEEAINDREGWSAQAVISWTPGDVSIVSTTSYRDFDRFNRNDLDVSDVWAFGRNDYTEQSESFSQEITVGYENGPLSLLGGAMYFTEDLFGEVRVPTVNLAGYFNFLLGTNLPVDLFDDGNFLQRGTVETEAFGAFLQASYEVVPDLTITAGARYNYEERVGVGRFTFEAQGLDVPTDRSASWDSITPKFLVEYRTAGDTLLYASVTRGFKSGVINIGSVNDVIDPEFVWSYEAGFRTETADSSFALNGSAFYYDYTDLQIGFVNENNIVETINAASARIWGVELEAVMRPADNLTVRAFATYLNSEFQDFCNGYYAAGVSSRRQFPACPDNPLISDLSGNQLPNAPELTVALFADYRIDLGGNGFLDLSGDVNLQDEVFFTEFNNQDARQQSFVLANASITYRSPDERWSLAVWGRNLFDTFAIANNITTAPLYGFVRVGSLRPPRTYGATFGVNF